MVVATRGDAGSVGALHALERKAALLLIGLKGLMDRILLGSVRTTVIRGAQCSVLIAPAHMAAKQ